MMNLIVDAVKRGASDLHIKTGDVIRARINGVLEALSQDSYLTMRALMNGMKV